MSLVIEVDFFNSYVVRKVRSQRSKFFFSQNGTWWPGATKQGGYGSYDPQVTDNWYIEESRIRGGFNNASTKQGVRAYLDDPNPLQQNRKATLIYSGIYNSRTGINQTNVFSVGTDITKSMDPSYGSIQKTYSEDTNLIVFQENRIHRALIDKDTIYTTESGTQTQAGAAVIGQLTPYKGEYGISKNPESFAIYNYRKYFSDRNRNAIMRLSNDGLTEVSMYGMMDWFRDNLAKMDYDSSTTPFKPSISCTVSETAGASSYILNVEGDDIELITPGMQINFGNGIFTPNDLTVSVIVDDNGSKKLFLNRSVGNQRDIGDVVKFEISSKSQIVGGWDIHNKNYVVSLQKMPVAKEFDAGNIGRADYTVVFDEKINGWVSFMDFIPSFMFSVLNKFYTTVKNQVYEHYYDDVPQLTFRSRFYNVDYGSDITFVFNQGPSIMKTFSTVSYEGSSGWEVEGFKSGMEGFDSIDGSWVEFADDIKRIRSYNEGLYTDPVTQQPTRAGFNRKENKYVANLVAKSTARPGEVRFGPDLTGIKGYFATVKIKTDETTDPGGVKELWSAGTEFSQSNGFQ